MTSIIKVNNLQNQCGANIISESSNTITIGASGDTITLAAGASQSGFGRSGSVNWDTTPKTANFTAVSGEGYFVDTTLGVITATLPATPSAGDIVAIADYANTAATNNITLGRNSSPIDGETEDAVILVNGQVYTLVYVDATEGWKTVGQTFNQITTPQYIVASGGTVTCCGDYKIHTFTGPGTFTVTSVGNPLGSDSVDYLVVAGGAGGGSASGGGGGGAGGYRTTFPSPGCNAGSFPISVQGYPITVGAGGSADTNARPTAGSNTNGSPSVFSSITSTGGGKGGHFNSAPGSPGGSGGGGRETGTGGTGNTPPTSPSQGNPGGTSPGAPIKSGGGGGASAAGTSAPPTGGGDGGAGLANLISGSSVTYAGGGGGGGNSQGGIGGVGGGGNGSNEPANPAQAAQNGTANTGGGGGGLRCAPLPASYLAPGGGSGAGGSGIVIIRYKYQ